MPSCRLCEEEITFSDSPEYMTMNGKFIPLDVDSAGGIIGKHGCSVWEAQNRRYYDCRKCGAGIYFDKKAAKSKTGKWVPQDKFSGSPHQCKD